jgi:predicted metalloprotease with PDZ domain
MVRLRAIARITCLEVIDVKNRLPVATLVAGFVLVASMVTAQPLEGTMAFTVSMDQPTTHYYHVAFRCDGLKGATQDFKMPEWTPGYYQIMDYARNVLNFRAVDGAGAPLAWEKTAKNTWRVRAGQATTIAISYDVYAFRHSVAESYLGDERGFIVPAAVFMHVAGQLRHAATVTVKPYQGWSQVSTGLDPVAGQPNTFLAQDFDILYDCPILVGNQEVMTFEVQGVPHLFAAHNMGALDRKAFLVDLKKIVESAVAVIGEIPYRHYTFLAIGPNERGGIEHLNSAALSFNPVTIKTPSGYKRWLAFVAHEFFHLYNVKRIRPIALGPFDYDKENYTNMLWVSEGISVYYEGLILNRAGLYTREDTLELFQSAIARYENVPGHLFQSATESSFDTWIDFFNRSENSANTTISYYDKGAALGMLLDLKIRNETRNRKTLDDVMRALYQSYYKEKQRGFTDKEFREVCESAAGGPLSEIFDVYASTTRAIDYQKYFAYAGLAIDTEPTEVSGSFLGAVTQDQGGNAVVSSVEWDSPASRAGLSAQDEILAVDGVRVTTQALADLLGSRKPGDRIRVTLARLGLVREVEVVLGKRMDRSYHIAPLPTPSALQAEILADWLKD